MGLSLPRFAFSLVVRANSARSFNDKAEDRGFTAITAFVFLSAVGLGLETLFWAAAIC